MTIPASMPSKATYRGDGVTVNFPVPFKYFENTNGTKQLKVVLADTNGKNEVVQIENTDFTITDAGANNGTLTMLVPPPLNYKLTIVYDVPIEQLTDYKEFGRLPSESIETALDKDAVILKQHKEILDRCIKVGVTSDTNPEILVNQVERIYSSIDNVDAVADNATNINAVNANKTNIDTVAGSIEDVSAVADNISVVAAVGENITNINTVASDSSNIGTVVNNLTAINAAPTYANDAQIWAEGTDGQVQTLGGVHSAKRWAETLAQSALVLNVKDYGAKGDGVTNDSNAFQAAFNDAHSKGGAIIFVPEGTYLVSNVKTYEHTNIKGVFGKTVIKRPNNTDDYIFRSAYIYNDNVFDYVSLEDIIFDGNKSNALGEQAKSLIAYYKVRYFYARNCIFKNSLGYGLGLQAYPNGAIVGTQSYVYMENCYFLNNGDGVTGDTMDGLDIKYCNDITLVGCEAQDNKDNGINIRGVNVSLIGCKAANNSNNGFALQGNAGGSLPASINVSGCFSSGNAGHGYVVWNGGHTGSKVDVIISNSQAKSNLNGIGLSDCSEVRAIINDCMLVSNTRNGFYITEDATSCSVANVTCIGNKNGININANGCMINDVYCVSNTEYGVVFGTGKVGNCIGGASRVYGNILGNFNLNGTKRNIIGNEVVEGNQMAAIASASTITLPQAYNLFTISGTEQIKTINASPYGRMVTLTFQSTASIKSGAGNVYICGDFNATSGNCMITLISDGSNWFEVSRKNANDTRVLVGVDAPVSLSDSVLVSKGEYVKPFNSYDNIMNLGSSAARWKEVFAGTGTINTSDERQKQNIEDIDEAVFRAWEKVDFKQFLFSDAVEKKGENARIHIGLIAQRVKDAFDSEGLDGFKYGLLCYDEWGEEKDEAGNVINPAGNAYGIRYAEALALECAYQRWKIGKIMEQLTTLNKE